MELTATLLFETHSLLGEAPLWHPLEKRYYWLDIENGILYRTISHLEGLERFQLDKQAGCFGFRESGGLIVATAEGFALWSEETGLESEFFHCYPEGSKNMMNDGRVDTHGRFWAGSKGPEGTSSLYLVDTDFSVKTILTNKTICNGIDWDAENRYCYFTDSGDRTIYRYDYAANEGKLSQPTVFYERGEGTPDGHAIDSEGQLWTGIWDGWQILRLSPEGKIVSKVGFPVSRPTSLAFGGEDFKDVLVTSASTGLDAKSLEDQPLAGGVFHFRSPIAGRPANFFKA